MEIIGPIFLIAGLGLLVGCAFAATRTRRFLASAQQARAEVVEVQRRGGSQSAAYHPVLRYRTAQGGTHEVVSSVGSNPPRYKEGDTVVVLYNPQRPTEVRIHSFFQVWIAPLILGVLGVIFTLVGGLLAVLLRG